MRGRNTRKRSSSAAPIRGNSAAFSRRLPHECSGLRELPIPFSDGAIQFLDFKRSAGCEKLSLAD
jgi:hypothetical protein